MSACFRVCVCIGLANVAQKAVEHGVERLIIISQVTPKFTCFNSTKVQILTLSRLPLY